jgi:SAM-dependent methyltransferase
VLSPLRTMAPRLRRLDEARTGTGWSGSAPFPLLPATVPESPAWCVICGWQGTAWGGVAHAESATCPRCLSIARDRFLFWCFLADLPAPGLRVLETSPRLDDRYRRAMGQWFDYRASDFEERAHRGSLRIDLQDIDLPDSSLDVLLTPHVLEHVADTHGALAEIHRVLAPGGTMYLQVPVLQGLTAAPAEPEYHGDDTLVHWRFGYDFTDVLRAHGFDTRLLVTDEWQSTVWARTGHVPNSSPEFDVASMLAHARMGDLWAVAGDTEAAAIGAVPAYMFCTWRCVKAH